jgi:hypothetical protein
VLKKDDERMPVAVPVPVSGREDIVAKKTEAREKKEIPTNLSFTVAVSYAKQPRYHFGNFSWICDYKFATSTWVNSIVCG